MMDIGKDPTFRNQYSGAVQPDPEFEAALGGASAPSFSMLPAPQPLGGAPQWPAAQFVRLR